MPDVNLPTVLGNNGANATFIYSTADAGSPFLRLNCAPGDFIRHPILGDITSIQSNVTGSSITLQAVDVSQTIYWFITSIVGTWT